MHQPNRFTITLLLSVALCGTARSQALPSSSSDSNPAGQRPQSTQVEFFELLESGSEAFLALFEGVAATDTINSPKWNSQNSPRETVLTFVEAMNHVASGRRQALDRALKTFPDDVSLKEGEREQRALDLLSVFDRLPEISPGTIPGSDIVEEADISRYELFPRGIQHDWAYKALGESPDGHIVLLKQGDRWVFDQSTVEGAGKLLNSMKAIPPRGRLERKGQLFASVIEPTVQNTSVGDWLWFLFSSAGGILLSFGLYRVIQRISDRRESRGDDLMTPVLNGVLVPSIILLVTIGIAIGTARLQLHPALSAFRWNVIEVALVIAGVWLVIALAELLCLGVRRTFFGDDDPYANMMSLVIRRSFRIFAGIILLMFVFQNVFQWNVTAIVGGFGVLALALSLAAKDAVKNLFGAMTIFANRPFLNGDWVSFNKQIGVVEDVSLQVTRIRVLTGEVLSVPNMKFIDEPVENLSMRKYLRRIMKIAITYDTPVEKVDRALDILKEILSSKGIAGEGQCDLEVHPPQVWFEEFGPHYLSLRADYWYLMHPDESAPQRDTERGWFSYLDHATKVNREVLGRFNKDGIDFAFPTQSIYVASDPDRPATFELEGAAAGQ